EHGEYLAVADAQRQPLERRGVALGRRVDAEDVLQLDRGGHAAASAARDGARPRSVVARPTRSAASRRYAIAAIASSGRSTTSRSGGSASAALAVTETSEMTS